VCVYSYNKLQNSSVGLPICNLCSYRICKLLSSGAVRTSERSVPRRISAKSRPFSLPFRDIPQSLLSFAGIGLNLNQSYFLLLSVQSSIHLIFLIISHSYRQYASQSALQPWASLGLLYNQSPPGVRFLNKIIIYRMGLLVPCQAPILEDRGVSLSLDSTL
jgi:hypothetical protein